MQNFWLRIVILGIVLAAIFAGSAIIIELSLR